MIGDKKEVYFTKCLECKYYNIPESEDPCCDCLEEPGREDSNTPLYFTKKETSENAKSISKSNEQSGNKPDRR